MRRGAFFCLFVACLFSACAQAKETPPAFDVGGIKVVAWLPKDSAPKPWPVILFSHGFHGCGTQSQFLMQALADAGYAVFAPNHADATCNGGDSSWFSGPEMKFGNSAGWDEHVYADRRDDIEKLLTLLPHDARFAKTVDWSRLGLAGHSLGGYTVLGLAGAWPGWKDGRVKAVLALSPYSRPFTEKHTLGGIHIPVMYQGGTRDFHITPDLKEAGGTYDQTPAPKYFVEFNHVGHFAFSDLWDSRHDEMSAYAIAFFDTYLRGMPFPQALMRQGEAVEELRIDAGRP